MARRHLQEAKNRLEAVAKELGVDIAVRDRRDWYF